MTQHYILRLGHQGDGIAEGPLFAPLTLPGETVSGTVEGDRLRDVRILAPSEHRVAPPCRHFKACGGCQLMHASDDFVAGWKQDIVIRALSAQGIEAAFRPIATSPAQSRRRATFSARRTKKGAMAGFHGRASGVIVEIPDCHLLHPDLLAARPLAEALAALGGSRKGEVSVQITLSEDGLDVLARGWVNSWGHHHDRFGQSFVTDGAGGEGINHMVPGAAYLTARGVPRILRGLNPGSPKFCGLEITSGTHLPEDWRGDLLTNDFRANRVCRFKLTPSGSSYQAKLMPDLIRTKHIAFRPIDIKMGPDGAIYIADWYNPIISHNEVPRDHPDRDKVRSRIWRIRHFGFHGEQPVELFEVHRALLDLAPGPTENIQRRIE